MASSLPRCDNDCGILRACTRVRHKFGGLGRTHVGGTILSSALAVLRARSDKSVASMTLLTTMLDFRDPGDLGVFVDEQAVSQREQGIGNSASCFRPCAPTT